MNSIAMMQWKVGLIHKELWSKHAQRGTLLVQTNGEEAQALLVDDDLGPRGAFKLSVDKVDEIIGAAAAAWISRGRGGSFAVVVDSSRKGRGIIISPKPPTPPGPTGHDFLRALTVQAHHQLLGINDVAGMFGNLERYADKDVAG